MGYEIVRGPFMLWEAVGMLYKFTNGISFRSVLSRHKFFGGNTMTERITRRMECLQGIMDEVCANLDPKDPELQRFFCCEEVAGENTCLAEIMTCTALSALDAHDVREHADRICSIWESLQSSGAWIKPESSIGLIFSRGEGCPGDLFDQIHELHCRLEFRVTLYKALRDFRKTMDELIRLIEPLAVRLEECFRRESWLTEETEEYWCTEFERIAPLEFLATACCNREIINGAGEHTLVAFTYMNSNNMSYSKSREIYGERECNILVIGSIVTATAVVHKKTSDVDTVGTILRSIGDKRRLDILRRLAKGRSYCHELADLTGIDSGNMSRNLALLHSFGFLRQEIDPPIYYYETDREAIHSFLQLVETIIFS